MLDFHIYDVFTDTPFTGNPLAIVEGADGLSTAQMQTIARQFNLSETIFVQTPDDPAHTAKVRIFFPTAEIPFAGHPTIGCALHMAGNASEVILEEVAGLVPVTIAGGMAEFTAPKLPRALPSAPDRATLAAALGLADEDLAPTPFGNFEGGPSFLYVEVTSLESLAKITIQEPAFTQTRQTAGDTGAIYAYVLTGPDSIQARMFDPPAGIAEDPATGSATALLAGQLHANGALPASGTTTFHLKQGVEMGRPSDLRLTVDTDGAQITAIRVAGQAVKIAQGQIRVPPS
ncbi:PhzF family phenazine biosynthesis protein [Rhodobacteraceae bacterium N5(2021)]|uniref:PhzF family phenazine biosynthesis protein n=1 Tax=Gymnodinialimonas phycosphaerae TaxID=2841589 RepID=A0A975TUU7_9RHOB|nr:PhzF family phenazine biosynthesis protein [Gymnodinialimonas phycosphaerae]MBY4895175.1 PhzF family phenazine biosynthesis protein [Gymnodinialimonas phycosphaerae]